MFLNYPFEETLVLYLQIHFCRICWEEFVLRLKIFRFSPINFKECLLHCDLRCFSYLKVSSFKYLSVTQFMKNLKNKYDFYIHGTMHRNSVSINIQQDASIHSLKIK
jgi:hypothetical protein